jgi:hypothetical protein
MTVHQRRLKIINLAIDSLSFDCQVQTWNIDPGIKTGDRDYTFCAAGEGQNSFIEETDPEPTLELKFFSDWRSDGISDFLQAHSMETVSFVLDHHPDVPDEHTRYSGQVQIQAAPIGGDARATEVQDVTLPIVGNYTYERVDS